ncbi:MAG: hypothetical protein Q7T17_10470 [Microbacterium sp.]|nr:hypothetical protein [Microbacterium sp.]
MLCLYKRKLEDGPLPDWEVCLRDSFGRPGEPVGGVIGPIHNAEDALNEFLRNMPELAIYPLIAVPAPIAPAWSMYDEA